MTAPISFMSSVQICVPSFDSVNIRLLPMIMMILLPVYLEECATVSVNDVHGLGVPLVQPTARPGYEKADKLYWNWNFP